MRHHRIAYLWTVVALSAVLASVSVAAMAYLARPGKPVTPTYGVSFSSKQAEELGLDSEVTYDALIDDLGVKRIRLAAYWDDIEPLPDMFVWDDLDRQLNRAAEHNVGIVLTVGLKLPRWPECFAPEWVSLLSKEEQDERTIRMVQQVVQRYAEHPAIVMWQLENEPFVGWFGHCPEPDPTRLERELAVIRLLSKKPVIVTDSGELSLWRDAAHFADRFGTTLYQSTWNPWLGYTYSLWPPAFYRLKARWNGIEPHDLVVSELQAEPWTPGILLVDTAYEEQMKSMSLDRFSSLVTYARHVGSSEVYLWGAEWWYWLMIHGHPEFWDAARPLFLDSTPAPSN